MTIVGRGVLSESAGAARLGDGAALTFDGMRLLVPDAVADVVLLDLRPGAAGKSLLGDKSLLGEVGPSGGGQLYLPKKPSALADLERVNGLPSIVAGLVGVMALGTLGHTLLTSVPTTPPGSRHPQGPRLRAASGVRCGGLADERGHRHRRPAGRPDEASRGAAHRVTIQTSSRGGHGRTWQRRLTGSSQRWPPPDQRRPPESP